MEPACTHVKLLSKCLNDIKTHTAQINNWLSNGGSLFGPPKSAFEPTHTAWRLFARRFYRHDSLSLLQTSCCLRQYLESFCWWAWSVFPLLANLNFCLPELFPSLHFYVSHFYSPPWWSQTSSQGLLDQLMFVSPCWQAAFPTHPLDFQSCILKQLTAMRQEMWAPWLTLWVRVSFSFCILTLVGFRTPEYTCKFYEWKMTSSGFFFSSTFSTK